MLQLSTRSTPVPGAMGISALIGSRLPLRGATFRVPECTDGECSVLLDVLRHPQADLLQLRVAGDFSAAHQRDERRVLGSTGATADHERRRGIDAPADFGVLVVR